MLPIELTPDPEQGGYTAQVPDIPAALVVQLPLVQPQLSLPPQPSSSPSPHLFR